VKEPFKTIVSRSDESMIKDTREKKQLLLTEEEMQEVHYEQYMMQEDTLDALQLIGNTVGYIVKQVGRLLIGITLLAVAVIILAVGVNQYRSTTNEKFDLQRQEISSIKESLKPKESPTTTPIEEPTTEEPEEQLEDSVEEVIPEVPIENTSVEIVNIPYGHNTKKTYTYYTALAKGTPQWRIQEQAHTDENGLRKVGDYYCCAVGTYYSNTVGDKFHIILDTGKEFDIIVCDVKSDRHTDSNHQYTIVSNCMLEFYVDSNLNDLARRMGDCSYIPGFEGSIVSIVGEV